MEEEEERPVSRTLIGAPRKRPHGLGVENKKRNTIGQ